MNKRQNKILELLINNEMCEVTQLATLLDVSQVTIRKDLNVLENNGMIKREHGYAKLNNKDNMKTRLAYHYDIKEKIALKAIEDVKDGDTVMIESGSCCALVAKALSKHRKNITVITNSAFICDYVKNEENINLILLGGQYQKESQVMVGQLTEICASSFFVDKYFIGTDGFTYEAGFTGKDYLRCQSVQGITKQANHVIIVTESEKFGKQGIMMLVPLNKISKVLTDQNINEDYEKYLCDKNIKVIKA